MANRLKPTPPSDAASNYYQITDWHTGDIITQPKMANIEEWLASDSDELLNARSGYNVIRQQTSWNSLSERLNYMQLNLSVLSPEGASEIIDEIAQDLTAVVAATSDANNAADRANGSADNADLATTRANTAAASIENLTVSTSSVSPGTPATATISTSGGARNIAFGQTAVNITPGTINVLNQGQQNSITLTQDSSSANPDLNLKLNMNIAAKPVFNSTVPTTTLEPGSDASAAISGPDANSKLTLSLSIPRGATPQFSIGTVESVPAEQSAQVTMTGTALAPVLNFKIPRGYVTGAITYSLTQDATDGHIFTLTGSNGDTYTITIPDNNTTYAEATTSVAGLMSANDKEKLNGIATGAQVNVNADWNAVGGDAQILNKPSIPTVTSDLTNDSNFVSDANYVHTDNNFTGAEKTKLAGVAAGAEVNTIDSVSVAGTALTPSNKAINISVMTGAGASTAGAAGVVPAPSAGDNEKYLRGDGTWHAYEGVTIDDIYPVGSIYMSVNSTSPATLFGGTWQQISGRFLLAAGTDPTSSTITYAAGDTGGASYVVLETKHLPPHYHEMTVARPDNTGDYSTSQVQYGKPTGKIYTNESMFTGSIAATKNGAAVTLSQGHLNMPPYLVVNMWYRTA